MFLRCLCRRKHPHFFGKITDHGRHLCSLLGHAELRKNASSKLLRLILTLVITACTNRKRQPSTPGLSARSLNAGSVAEVAEQWAERLRQPVVRHPLLKVYGGRSFQDAVWVAEQLNADMAVVSAGLGLLAGRDVEIPAYNCTIVDGSVDSLPRKTTDAFSRKIWWRHLSGLSPYSVQLGEVVAQAGEGVILAALSDAYLDMLSDDLEALAGSDLARLRIFSRAPLTRIAPHLRPFVMPYDDRLDGPNSPIRGTRSDFACRALRHFADVILASTPAESVEFHANAVAASLAGLFYPLQIQRERLEDVEIIKRIHEHWEAAAGSSARLLRIFRDQLNVACEQGRFAQLVRQVRAERS
jgi:hypothetical protein